MYNEKTDLQLYKEFLSGNNEAFNLLIIKHRKKLTRFLMCYVKNIEIAEDIAQDSFLYMIIHRKDYNFKYSFRTYLYTIAKSRALNYLKKEKRKVSLDEIDYESYKSEFNIEDEVVNKDSINKILSVIGELKEDYQIIIHLYYFQNFKYREISEILNISMSKTKMLLSRAKKSIKKVLKEE